MPGNRRQKHPGGVFMGNVRYLGLGVKEQKIIQAFGCMSCGRPLAWPIRDASGLTFREPLAMLAEQIYRASPMTYSQKVILLAPDDQFRDSLFGRLNFKTRPHVLKQLKFLTPTLS